MITYKSQKDIELMHEGGQILDRVLRDVAAQALPGVLMTDLDTYAHDAIIAKGCRPAFLGLYGFPGTLCLSVNNEVVHGIPRRHVLKEGDLLSLDIGLIYETWYLDMAVTIPILGSRSYEEWAADDVQGARLLGATQEALAVAAKECRPGVSVGDLGVVIQKVIESAGFGIVKDLAGHGIGKKLHEDPLVPNWGKAGSGHILKEGMVLAIEPIVTEGSPSVRVLSDGFTYVTRDSKRAAHFEHTIAVMPSGGLILTKAL